MLRAYGGVSSQQGYKLPFHPTLRRASFELFGPDPISSFVRKELERTSGNLHKIFDLNKKNSFIYENSYDCKEGQTHNSSNIGVLL